MSGPDAADTRPMEADARVLRQLISADMYVVEERSVADAILVRSRLHATLGRPTLANERWELNVRSFRRAPRARSFRLVRPHAPTFERR